MASSKPESARSNYLEALWIERILRQETIGGLIIVAAAVLAVLLANSPLGETYFGIRDTYFSLGFGDAYWKISIGHLTADGLLAIFFFLVGLELKREFVVGELRDPKKALVPVIAAVGGVIVPALLFLYITNALGEPDAARGWAIPIATDIAFALAVLALVGTWLPLALRTFLLTLAVVDDLIGITIIAVVYTDEVILAQPLFLFGVCGGLWLLSSALPRALPLASRCGLGNLAPARPCGVVFHVSLGCTRHDCRGAASAHCSCLAT